MTSLICSFFSYGFVMDCQRGRLLGHMCFSCYRTYVTILCNWLILWQNALYLYLGRLRMCLTTSRNHVSKSSVEAFKSVQEIKQECKFIKVRQLVDTCSTPPICRGLRILDFNSDFLGIRESVYGPSFLLTLDIQKDCFKSRQMVHKLHKHWANSVQANCNRRQGS